AEDGIRDRNVTGVQTCALPIYAGGHGVAVRRRAGGDQHPPVPNEGKYILWQGFGIDVLKHGHYLLMVAAMALAPLVYAKWRRKKIGRASCRERVKSSAGGRCVQ